VSHLSEPDVREEDRPAERSRRSIHLGQDMVRTFALALIFLLVGVALAALALAYIPDPGSPPSIFDDFRWSSTENGYWHVNAVGASASISHSVLPLSGDSIELDHRIQTDPVTTVVSVKVRGLKFHKFGMGIGVFHAGTVGMEFDDDGVKCGRASEYGWKIDYLKSWRSPPVGKWYYLEMSVTNPYPHAKDTSKIPKDKLKPVKMVCSLYDASGKLLSVVNAVYPPPATNYDALDEVFVRTWDTNNEYQVDWVYSGPRAGDPIRAFAP
jgi:hypothetical protein